MTRSTAAKTCTPVGGIHLTREDPQIVGFQRSDSMGSIRASCTYDGQDGISNREGLYRPRELRGATSLLGLCSATRRTSRVLSNLRFTLSRPRLGSRQDRLRDCQRGLGSVLLVRSWAITQRHHGTARVAQRALRANSGSSYDFLTQGVPDPSERMGKVNRIDRFLRRLVNPVSTGLTRAWCDSPLYRWALRHGIRFLTEMPKSRRTPR